MKSLFLTMAAALISVFALTSNVSTVQAEVLTLNVCSGKDSGNYYYAVDQIKAQAKGVVNIVNVPTLGSWENLQKIASGECDAAIIQADAWGVWNAENPSAALNLDRVDVLYDEFVHLFCNRDSGIDELSDLADNSSATVAYDANGAGSQITWKAMGLMDDDYGLTTGPKRLPIGGIVALSKVKSGTDVQCGVYVAGLNSGFMNKVQEQAESVLLVELDDGDMDDARDPKGNRIYEFVEIDGSVYGDLQDGSDVETIAVKATLVIDLDWAETNPSAYENFVEAQLNAQPFIREHVGQ